MTEPQPISPQDAAARLARVAEFLTRESDPYLIADLASAEEYADLDPDAGDPDEPWSALGDLRAGDIYLGFASTEAGDPVYGLLEGGAERWHAIGQIDSVPLLVDRADGSIWHPVRASTEWDGEPAPERIAPDIWTFAAHYALGPGYLELTPAGTGPDNDPWAAFLSEHGLLDPHAPGAEADEKTPESVTYDELRGAWGASGLLRFPAERYPDAPGLHPDLLPPAALYPQHVPVLLRTDRLPGDLPLGTELDWPTPQGNRATLVVIGAPADSDTLLYCLDPDTGAVLLTNPAAATAELVNTSLAAFVTSIHTFVTTLAATNDTPKDERATQHCALRERLHAIDAPALTNDTSWWNLIAKQSTVGTTTL